MNFRILLTNEREEDAATATNWHNEKSAGLGNTFLQYPDEVLKKIQQSPSAYKKNLLPGKTGGV